MSKTILSITITYPSPPQSSPPPPLLPPPQPGEESDTAPPEHNTDSCCSALHLLTPHTPPPHLFHSTQAQSQCESHNPTHHVPNRLAHLLFYSIMVFELLW